jgi:hypothetical protein
MTAIFDAALIGAGQVGPALAGRRLRQQWLHADQDAGHQRSQYAQHRHDIGPLSRS